MVEKEEDTLGSPLQYMITNVFILDTTNFFEYCIRKSL